MVAPALIQVEEAAVAGHRSKAKAEEGVGQYLMARAAAVVGQSLKGVVEVEGVDCLSKVEVV